MDAVDVQLTINSSLGIDAGDADTDVNDDGFTNAIDVQQVINAALAGGKMTPTMPASAVASLRRRGRGRTTA